jgi:hypothetical protein
MGASVSLGSLKSPACCTRARKARIICASSLSLQLRRRFALTAKFWLDLERAAAVVVTSEEENFPVESALVSGETQGWRAAIPGTQTIRLVFDQPQRLKRIALVFEEHETKRTQEFVLRWSSDGGCSFREIVRQQWNFQPTSNRPGTPRIRG